MKEESLNTIYTLKINKFINVYSCLVYQIKAKNVMKREKIFYSFIRFEMIRSRAFKSWKSPKIGQKSRRNWGESDDKKKSIFILTLYSLINSIIIFNRKIFWLKITFKRMHAQTQLNTQYLISWSKFFVFKLKVFWQQHFHEKHAKYLTNIGISCLKHKKK